MKPSVRALEDLRAGVALTLQPFRDPPVERAIARAIRRQFERDARAFGWRDLGGEGGGW